MLKFPLWYACVCTVLTAAILACLAWSAWALVFRTPPAGIPADASFVKEVVEHALI